MTAKAHLSWKKRYMISTCKTIKWLFAAAMPLYIHESSSASTASTSATTNNNLNASGGDGSQVINASGGSGVQVLDNGAIHDAFGFAQDIAQSAFNEAAASRADSTKTAEDALNGVMHASDSLKDAYTTAKAGEQKVLVGVGLAIVGVVALAALKGKL